MDEYTNIQSLFWFNLGSPNIYFAKIQLLISKFLYKTMVTMLHKTHVSI